jgi:lysophospholipase L1-like esterase
MRRTSIYMKTVFVLLLTPAVLLAQGQAPAVGAPAAGAQAPGGARGAGPGAGAAGAGQRGPAGPPSPANVAFHNERNDARHQIFVDIAKKGDIGLLFVGDSITDWFFWPRGNETTGGKVWEASFAPLKAANFAIAGDTTQGVLWRMQNGELQGFKAKLIVLMLGTNNTASNPVGQIIEGDRLIVEEFKKQQPQAKILVLGIFPRNNARASQQTPILNATIKAINVGLSQFADDKQVFYMDIGDKFLVDGLVPADIMADGLHPTAKGYQIWADAILPTVKGLMQ